MTGALAYAFLAGTITSVNPCGLALLPAYFARRIGVDAAGQSARLVIVARALKIGVITTFGVLVVFSLAGGVISLGGLWLTATLPWAGLVIGIILAAVGLLVMSGKRLNVRLPMPKRLGAATGMNADADLSYGIGYGIVSLSCSLPIFLTVIGVTLNGNATSSIFSFIAFGLGIGTVLTGLSVAAAFAHNGLAARLKRFLPYVNRVSGALLFLAGAYVALLWGSALSTVALPGRDILVSGELLSGMLKGWFAERTGQILISAVLLLLVAIAVWSFIARRVGQKYPPKEISGP